MIGGTGAEGEFGRKQRKSREEGVGMRSGMLRISG